MLDEDRLRRLIEAGRSVVSEHELERVLDRLLTVARELTGARYAAIGVLDERREALTEFVTAGISRVTYHSIGRLPSGRGVLGLLISRPEPLRVADVSSHAGAYGFPPGHPAMTTFLGVPILIRGEAWGNLYLTDRQDGLEFDEADEGSAVVLAAWAAIAVDNARLSRQADQIRAELERSVRAHEVTSAQLEADLRALTADLTASRIRLVETADAERQRIERDLHDGVQQDLVGLRIKLEMGAEAIKEEPDRGEQMIASLGRQLDHVLEELRSLARGIYPSLLHQRGLGEALKSAARRSPLPVSVDARGLLRCREEVEVAVYFCCLEALQNFIKHAGRGAEATIRVRQRPERLCFEVRDSGAGFDPDAIQDRHGLLNMRDRIEAVGGTLTVSSHKGQGTSVRGSVPIA